jgi:signal transduction histidine kinase
VCYFREISAQVKARLAIVASDEALKVADHHKDEFLATLAHELRGPLATLHSALEVIKLARNDADAVGRSLPMMERQVGQMKRLIEDLLDVSRVSHGQIELRKERTELASALNHAIEVARPLCASKDQYLTVTAPQSPIFLNVDPTRLAQMVGNLLNNASKFTGHGGVIHLAVEREDAQAVVRVRDTGIGIAAHQFDRIFEVFTQVGTSRERTQSGLGIGLALVRTLAQMHGGTVEVRSAGLGLGSEFFLRLPLAVEAPAA